MPTSRRDFMREASALLGGAACLPRHWAMTARSRRAPDQLSRIGVQLYTVRSLMEKSVERTLAQVAQAGYSEVEFAGYFGRTPAQIADRLAQYGLTSPSAHVGLPEMRGADWPRHVETAARIGHTWLVLAWIPDADRASVDTYKAVGDTMLAAADVAKKAGLRVGYHNHDFEFAPLGPTRGYDVLLEHTKGTDITFEMDLYWTVRSGVDPLAYFAKWPGRFPLVHVKDSSGAPTHTMMDVGKGQIDFGKIFAQRALAGTTHFYVEHDQPGDPVQTITASAAYLRALNF